MPNAPKKKVAVSRNAVVFISIFIVLTAIAAPFLHALYNFSSKSGTWSYIPLIPFISIFFMYRSKKEIFHSVGFSFNWGVSITLIGIILYSISTILLQNVASTDSFCLRMISFLIALCGAFILCFGAIAFKKALFPLLFLLFMAPFPIIVEKWVIELFRFGSAEMANIYFSLSGVEFIREGATFHLDNLSINVADECSGIHSGLSLLIVSVIAAKLFLRAPGARVLFVITIVPIGWIKNGMRIATLTLLGNYVNIGFIHGPLHRQGGRPFFIIALILLGTSLWICRIMEKKLWRSLR
jgi:exosortase